MISTRYLTNTIKGIYGAASTTLLLGCATPIAHYADTQPLLNTDYFLGEMSAHGIVKDWKGKVIRHFNADLAGHREGDQIILNEFFEFSDGEKQRRRWVFQDSQKGRFEATAEDVLGPAKGEYRGNTMYMSYDLKVNSDGQSIVLSARDALYRVNAQTLLSESTLYKFGLPVAAVTLVINKRDSQQATATQDVNTGH